MHRQSYITYAGRLPKDRCHGKGSWYGAQSFPQEISPTLLDCRGVKGVGFAVRTQVSSVENGTCAARHVTLVVLEMQASEMKEGSTAPYDGVALHLQSRVPSVFLFALVSPACRQQARQ